MGQSRRVFGRQAGMIRLRATPVPGQCHRVENRPAWRSTYERTFMTYQTIEVRKLTPHIGAEIFGVDLSRSLGNQQFQEVHDALKDRLVIFFRDQKLSI